MCGAYGERYEQFPMTDFSTLYKKYAPDVFRFALYLSGDRGQAEDITSETFVRAWTSRERIEVATVKAYLFTIARNLFLQGLRRKSRPVQLDRELPDPRASPYLQAEQKDQFRAVLRGLEELPEIDRAALLMRAQDGMAYEEISRTLGISLSSAKVKIHRARLVLAGIRHA
jgi:RNA polymerase sigma-70 factor (ECF subfamily)